MREAWGPRAVFALAAGGLVLLAGCGRKGPPLPPLRPVPGPVTSVTARRVNGRLELRFTIPTTNTDHSSPAAVSRIEIYARSVPEKSPRPVKEQVVLKADLIDTIEVKPPASESDTTESPATPPPPDSRPGTGEATLFTETLPTGAPPPLPALKGKAALAAAAAARSAQAQAAAAASAPTGAPGRSSELGASGAAPPTTPPAGGATTTGTASGATPPATPPATAATTTAAGAASSGTAPPTGAAAPAPVTPPAPPKPLPAMRYYWIQSISPHGQIGPPADLVAVPLTEPPASPTEAKTAYDEKTLTVTWQPGAAGETYQVYEIDPAGKETDGHPLNAAPLKEAQYQAPVVFDKQRCFEVRAVDMTGSAGVESDAAAETCVTPKDTFPPPAPTNLNGLPDVGSVALRWDPVTADDLAGYLVLRGEGTGDTLQQLTPTPLTSTTFVDTTVQSGATYVYVVVAVDKATPPNESQHSNTYSVTIR